MIAVLLDGSDVATDILEFKTHLGYVPEDPNLYSYLTGPDYLLLVGRLRGLSEDLLEEYGHRPSRQKLADAHEGTNESGAPPGESAPWAPSTGTC